MVNTLKQKLEKIEFLENDLDILGSSVSSTSYVPIEKAADFVIGMYEEVGKIKSGSVKYQKA
jgi:hypothetical protein